MLITCLFFPLSLHYWILVIDFLGCIPMLQQLPATSIQQIAQSVKIKSFGKLVLIIWKYMDCGSMLFVDHAWIVIPSIQSFAQTHKHLIFMAKAVL